MDQRTAGPDRLRTMKWLAGSILMALVFAGCASTGPTTVQIPPGGYAQAFSITKDEIRSLGFTLARIDARDGVITSAAKSSAGFATPWIHTEASFGANVDSFFHRDQRRMTISFEPVGEVADARASPLGPDRRSWKGELTCNVSVMHERLYRPGLRLSPVAVRLSNVTSFDADAGGAPPATIIREIGEDTHLESKLARLIRDRLGAEAEASATTEKIESGKSDEPGKSDGAEGSTP